MSDDIRMPGRRKCAVRAMEGPTPAITAGACGFRMESDVLEATAGKGEMIWQMRLH